MNKQEQIDEMAFDLCMIDTCKHLSKEECADTTCAHCEAEALYNAGYRRQEEVATEIISEIEQAVMAHGTKYASKRLDEIKKKYGVTEDESEG